MKRIIALILVLLLFCALFAGCGDPKRGESPFVSDRFRVVSFCDGTDFMDNSVYEITVVDSATGVLYLYIYAAYRAAMTPLYNADGSLMVYDPQNDPLPVLDGGN